ncbi:MULTISPECIES: Na(+)/H(+) antiporter subunit C [unclassified Rothia (in: high G+C Gram-positive bacteria)]|uniref:Na(+)/H(+) antiporter subunit C n=1 Tax=unclassified Rothia (in: high G+C Gram-positive bacteria) TaxID=2689056 RepID=UPI0019583168|nr:MULTISPECIES: Na(+)/H(+) antiporter subunit C [unclassified Rothia (in: high G+C Gram-positive bacteria)]MBM7051664.1 Na(+)/H(+) antiporter subunit C [Rothia sp. ZJ1223]QRZ61698.1 Na(+)/H(+) antiporter subunit C [Rothia sp. ZJ932]
MIIDLSLILVMGVFYAVGVYLVLARSLTRVLLGLMLISNATNLLIFHAAGPAGLPVFYEKDIDPSEYSDPLPQALVLTAIVIGFAMVAFILGMIYRGWVLSRADEIQDDDEDIRVASADRFDAEEDALADVEESEFDADEQTRLQQQEEENLRRSKAGSSAAGVDDDEEVALTAPGAPDLSDRISPDASATIPKES